MNKLIHTVVFVAADSAAELVTSGDDTIVLIQDDGLEDSGGTVDDRDEPADNEDYNEISVPLTVVLSVIGGYIIFGTVLFGLWEGWEMDTAHPALLHLQSVTAFLANVSLTVSGD